MSAENRHETPEERKARIEREAEAFAKEGLNVVPGTKPFTRYKVAELILCLLAVILGLLYLYTDPKIVPLDVLMPAYAAIFWIIIPLRLKDAKVLGTKGAARFFSVVVWVILALAVTAATAVYFIWY
ncbi:MAG: hypothetical protein II953_03830 [Clostridia bacterium]|nr:hypothetical protein [Clostridia bacterium]